MENPTINRMIGGYPQFWYGNNHGLGDRDAPLKKNGGYQQDMMEFFFKGYDMLGFNWDMIGYYNFMLLNDTGNI